MFSLLFTIGMAHTNADPSSQFDFWVGTWTMETETRSDPRKDEWQKSKSTNKIEKVMDGKVIQENFSGDGLTGKSWSVYDAKNGVWRQTWVDNQSSYISLVGKFENGQMVLNKLPNAEGERPYRMIFKDIKKDSFEWIWEIQMKDGKWAPMFICHYKRKKS